MQHLDPITIISRRPLPTFELQRLDKNSFFYWPSSGFKSYTFAGLIVKFYICILRERKHLNAFISCKQNKMREFLEIINPRRYKVSFNQVNIQSERK